MKMFYFLLAAFFMHTAVLGQAAWKVTLNDKTVLNASAEDEAKNIVYIKTADLKKKKDLILSYKEKKNKAGWERAITVYDENDRELKQQKGTKFTLSPAELRSFFRQSGKLRIYTRALPTDPKLKAAIRVRRVHLCTLIAE
jgi:hypothetical protein